MRILQVGKYPRERCGGLETAVFTLSDELAKEHDVEVAVCGPRGGAETRGRLTTRVFPSWGTVFSTPIAPSLAAHLRRCSFDVLQVSLQNPMAVAAVMLARPPGRLVAWYHHDIVRQRALGVALEPLQRAFLARADAIVATSAGYADTSPSLRRFRGKVRVIPLGVDEGRLGLDSADALARRVRARTGTPLVAFVGRLVYYKGLDVLLDAMRDLDARLLIVGKGPLERGLRARAVVPPLSGRVFFEDVPYDRPLGPYWLAADVAVLPSTQRTEAFGLSLVEAMACSRPVVTTALGTGTTEVCTDGVNGLVVPPGDAAALADALSRLLGDAALARRLGAAGRARFETRYSAPVMARSFVELYRGLMMAPC